MSHLCMLTILLKRMWQLARFYSSIIPTIHEADYFEDDEFKHCTGEGECCGEEEEDHPVLDLHNKLPNISPCSWSIQQAARVTYK